MHSLDKALQKVVHRALGNDVDTITQADLLTVIEMFAVEEEAVIVVPRVDMLPLSYGQSGGQEGGGQGKIIPKTFARCK